MTAMRIGVDASCWANRRGYGRYTRELLHTLLDVDRTNHYSFYLDEATAAQCPDLPATTTKIVAETRHAAVEAASATGNRSVRDLWSMSRAVGKQGKALDLFYFPSVYTYYPVQTRAPVLVTIHDTIPERFPHLTFSSPRTRLMWSLKVRLAIRQAAAIATVSETARSAIVNHFGVPPGKVVVISDAVGREFRPLAHDDTMVQVLHRYGVSEGERFVLYVGGLSPHKNLPVLLEAFASLVADDKWNNVKLVLVGDYSGDVFLSGYDALRRAAAAPELGDRVIFTGFVPDEDLVYVYNAAGVLVLPSLDEGFGLPAVEAMACGTPVIVSRAGALPEVVGDAGMLFDPHSPWELKEHLEKVLADGEKQTTMRQRGLRRSGDFSWEKSAAVALEVFEKLGRRR